MRSTKYVLFCLSLCVLYSCANKPVPAQPPVNVNLYTVQSQRVWYYDKYPSTSQPINQVNLYPEAQGYVTGIFFKEGSHVRKGQILYEIDKRLYQAAYDQAEANLKVAEGNLDQAQQDADRYVYLNSYNAVAKQQYDHAVIALQNAKNTVNAAKESLKTAKTNLAYSVISAPFDGTVGFSQVKIGNMVTIGQTLLNTISSDDPMGIDFLVNEKQLPAFGKMSTGAELASDSLFTLLLPDNTAYPYPGKILIMDRAVNAQTGSLRIRLSFPNPDYTLRPGMSCIVRVHNRDTLPQMVVPARAIVEQMGEYFVFVAKDTLVFPKQEGDKTIDSASARKVPGMLAFQKKVQTGQIVGANIVIKNGIEIGDRVVVDGVQLLHDGNQIVTGQKQDAKAGTGK